MTAKYMYTELTYDSQSTKIMRIYIHEGMSCYLASAESNDKISNGCVLRLTTAMRHHHTPACLLRHLTSLDWLSHWADLIHLQQQAVASLLVNGLLYSLWIGDRQIISATENYAFYDITSEIWFDQLMHIYLHQTTNDRVAHSKI